MKIITKVIFGFSAVLILTMVVGVIGWNGLNQFVKGVDDQQDMTSLAARTNHVAGDVLEFRASGELEKLSRARLGLKSLTEDTEGLIVSASDPKKRAALESVKTAIGTYLSGLTTFHGLETETRANLDKMRHQTAELEALATKIVDSQRVIYADAVESLNVVEKEQAARLGLAAKSDDLILNTLKARHAEARYRLTNDRSFAKEANTALRNMFMTSLRMKKLAKGTDDEGPVNKVFPVVTSYRKGFGELMTAHNDGDPTAIIEQGLTSVSTKINMFTNVIANRQKSAYKEAQAKAAAARTAVDKAVAGQRHALQLTALVRQVRIGEGRFLETHADADVASIETSLKAIFVEALKLKRVLTSESHTQLVNKMALGTKDYERAFAAVATSIKEQDTAFASMKAAQDEVVGLVASAAEVQRANLDGQRDLSTMLILVGSAIAVAMGAVFAYVIGLGITGPIGRMVAAMGRLAENDLTVTIPGNTRKDEIGEMAKAVQVFKENAERVERLANEQKEQERRTESEKRQLMNKMADEFDSTVGALIDAVSSASGDMHKSAKTMSVTADETTAKSNAVASAAEVASGNVQNVAAATEELSSSISEIGRQASQSADIARNASSGAELVNSKVEGLKTAADKIGEVVGLITDIAEQTNLLALNATIEAARAGDAGKGFAVVASEVKGLATQTAKATEEIGNQIGSMQMVTNEAVDAIQTIVETIQDINSSVNSIAAAVDEQSAATNEIAASVEQAASGTSEVTNNISGVNSATQETGIAANEVLAVSGVLSDQSSILREEVNKFLEQVRAA